MDYPKTLSFNMKASSGSWKGSFFEGQATIRATLIDDRTGIYRVIMRAPKPYTGPYEYEMPYEKLKEWKSNANNASWYNNYIRGNIAYFPK